MSSINRLRKLAGLAPLVEAAKEQLYGVYAKQRGQEKFGLQFSGTRKECTEEWDDMKGQYDADSKKTWVAKKIVALQDNPPTTLDESHSVDQPADLDDAPALHEGSASTCAVCDECDGPLDGTENIYLSRKDKLHYIKDGEAYRQLTDTEKKEFETKNSSKVEVKEAAPEGDPTLKVVDNESEKQDRTGVKQERERTFVIPADVTKQVNNRIKELEASIKKYDDKGYSDKSLKNQAIECMKKIMHNLESKDIEGYKQAQIYFQTLMSPLTDLIPAQLVNFLANEPK